MIEYRQFAPPAHLAPWVECVWTLKGVAPGAMETILPDGRMELVVHQANRPAGQDASFVTGQITGPVTLHPAGEMLTRGWRLRPAAAGSFLGMPASELAGQFVPLSFLKPRPPKAPPDTAITHAVELLEAAAGNCRMDDLTRAADLSPRQLDRRFLSAVGLPPKAFARIVRFQALLTAYRAGEYTRWADLALQCGFYDQAHLANEFRQFAGAPPTEFFRAPSALALLMANFSKTAGAARAYDHFQCDY